MSAPTPSELDSERRQTGCYVYGVVPGDVQAVPGARGVGDPPSEIRVVRHNDVAALVSEVDIDRPLGRPDDLIAHERVLDAAVADTPVLPMRFGAVITDAEAVAADLLAAHHDQLVAALREMQGRAEYVVKARYVEPTILREVLRENRSAARLREEIAGRPEDETRGLKMQLGEIINTAVEAKRQADTQAVVDVVGRIGIATSVRPPTHEQDAAHVAVLADVEREGELEQALGALVRDWEGRVRARLLGPLAPYDFVVTAEPGAE